MNIYELRREVEQRKGSRNQLISEKEQLECRLKERAKDLRRHEEAREIIRTVALKTQKKLQFHISDITSLALEAVFDDPYKLSVLFVNRRQKTECDLLFERAGYQLNPMSASGVGPVAVAAFALRVACWSMQRPRSNNVLILDEPFKHCKGIETNTRILDMINKVSKALKLQIIMVSDERIPLEDIVEKADRVFRVTIHKGISKVTMEEK